MTKEDFENKMESLISERNAIENAMRQLQKDYSSSYPIKPGDKCVDSHGKECWFVKLTFFSESSTHPWAMVNYAKKDGTRSKREQYGDFPLTKVEE